MKSRGTGEKAENGAGTEGKERREGAGDTGEEGGVRECGQTPWRKQLWEIPGEAVASSSDDGVCLRFHFKLFALLCWALALVP